MDLSTPVQSTITDDGEVGRLSEVADVADQPGLRALAATCW
jgi:hypothetical protein